MKETDREALDYIHETYGEALGLIRDLLKDAERIYEPGFEDPPHIAAAKDLTEHEGSLNELQRIASQPPASTEEAADEETGT